MDTGEKNEPAASLDLTEEEQHFITQLGLMSMKSFIFAGNIHEDDISQADSDHYSSLKKYAEKRNIPVLPVSAKVEAELVGMSPEEEKELLAEFGLKEPSLNAIIRETYQKLGYITFFTAGEKEVKAWNIIRGSSASEAAGKIHTDIQKGFIRAEVTSLKDVFEFGGLKEAQQQGKMRLEGKDYIVQDADVIYFRFNV